MEDFDVCVIGAGYGGATVAALLAHAGWRVALVEKTARAGGKTQTTERKGYHFEMFGAVGIPALNSRFHELVERLGIAERVPFVVPEGNAASVRYKAPDGTWRTMRTPLIASGSPEEMANLKRVYGVDDEALAALGNFYGALFAVDDAQLAALENVGMLAWMAQFGLATPLVSQICMSLNTLFVVAVDRLAASEAIPVLRAQVLGGASPGAREVLKATFGYDRFRPGQEDIIQAVLAGSHRIAGVPDRAGHSADPPLPGRAPAARGAAGLGLPLQIDVESCEQGGLFSGDSRTGVGVVGHPGLGRAELERLSPGCALPAAVGEDGWWRGAHEDAVAADLRAQFVERGRDEVGRRPVCLLYTSPSPRDRTRSRMPSSA